MTNERLLTNDINTFRQSIRNDILFNIGDINRAVLEGCNAVTLKQHPKAQSVVDEYTASKSKDTIYTEGDMVKAFEYGAREMIKIVDEEKEKVRLSMLVTRQNLQKAAKLVCACEQLMTIADGFNKEAQACLSKQGVFKTEIKSEWGKAAKIFRNLNSRMNKTFMTFSIDEANDWGDETEALENSIRDIMKIDVFENEYRN